MRHALFFILVLFASVNAKASSGIWYKNTNGYLNRNPKFIIFEFRDSSLTIEDSASDVKRSRTIELILSEGEKLIGLPYKAKDLADWPLDCSGFTSYIFSLHDVKLPRSSESQSELGDKISLKDAAPGDLLFFTGRNINSGKVGHVAIVVKNDGGKITMLHSCSRGIRYDEFPKMKYYKDRFIKCVRLNIDSNSSKS